jgi:hypothetical protein
LIFINIIELLSDNQQLNPDQKPMSYYEKYNIDHLADTNDYLFQESNDDKTDFGSIIRSVIFDDKKTNSSFF